MPSPARLVVMCSGSGTNLQAIINAISTSAIPHAQIVKVFVNRKTAYAVTRAAAAGIPSTYFNMVKDGFHAAGEKDDAKLRDARAKYDAALAQLVLAEKPDLVVLAGWMQVFTPQFLNPVGAAGVPVINLHPALPGKYDGANAIGRAYNDFQEGKLENGRTGCMIHYVIAEVDRGDPIMVEEVACIPGESLQDLEQRMHQAEHELIVRATAKVVAEIVAKKESR
ncbi:hypothetical protein TD95_003371 [Thielaviopsis punctulata]|uniref:Phosphoribosylglycinamide formyltransferase n=1 Tax=Thielaviopsis punctulata TaxID=72032 RepID=A0A0F4ZJX9_9PEZI|nr:hypothetical protein TD95_003371 [Thielaviopsis punctulata]